jgi:hypothetical protein
VFLSSRADDVKVNFGWETVTLKKSDELISTGLYGLSCRPEQHVHQQRLVHAHMLASAVQLNTFLSVPNKIR